MRYNWDWERFGEDIRNTVQNAVDSGDFRRLNQTITDTVNSAVESFMGGVDSSRERRGFARAGRRRFRDTAQSAYKYPDPRQLNRDHLYVKTGGKKVAALALAITGYTFCGLLLIAFLSTAAAALIFGSDDGIMLALYMLGIFAVLFGILAGAGTRKLSRVRRFRIYLEEIKGREYCNIRDLAERIRKKERFVQKDAEKMIRSGWFKQGHLDEKETCLMTSDAAYEQYRQLMEQAKQYQKMTEEERLREEEEARRQRQEEEERSRKRTPEVQQVMEAGNLYIGKIRMCNDAIPGEAVSEKISRMEILTRRIFERVEQDPDTVQDIRKLLDYYLPTAVKLLEAYQELDRQPVQGENIQSSKKEIEDTLDTLNAAFERLLDSLFQERAWDLSADISVLKTMLAQEGLTEADFKKK